MRAPRWPPPVARMCPMRLFRLRLPNPSAPRFLLMISLPRCRAGCRSQGHLLGLSWPRRFLHHVAVWAMPQLPRFFPCPCPTWASSRAAAQSFLVQRGAAYVTAGSCISLSVPWTLCFAAVLGPPEKRFGEHPTLTRGDAMLGSVLSLPRVNPEKTGTFCHPAALVLIFLHVSLSLRPSLPLLRPPAPTQALPTLHARSP